MPVESLLAFRSNKWHRGRMQSPVYCGFQWKSDIVWADCPQANKLGYIGELEPEHPLYEKCRLDIDGHLIPGYDHTCGIWTTLHRATFRGYLELTDAMLFLVEQLGEAIPGYHGFRSGGGQLIAVINTGPPFVKTLHGFKEVDGELQRDVSPYGIALFQTARYFNIPILPLKVAIEMARIQWEKLSDKLENQPFPL